MVRNGQEATTKVEVQLIEVRRRIEAQKSQAGLSQASSSTSDAVGMLLLKSNESARSSSEENDPSKHSKISHNSSFRDDKEGEQAIRRNSLRLPPLEPRGLSPSKSSSRPQLMDRMYDVIMLDQMMPIMVISHPSRLFSPC